jgi:hypothetical protein
MDQLIFASARSKKNTQLAVAFLTTRVRDPDEDNWMKPKRLQIFIRITIHMPLILREDSINVVNWWVDSPFTTHNNCRGDTGTMMSLGRGSITTLGNTGV